MGIDCLLIDDSQEVLESLRRLLESEGMIVVGTASTGTDGVRRARQLRPRVVLLDVELGDESGLEVARRLAALALGIAVILISAHSEYDELVTGSPAVGFLSKRDISRAAIEEIVGRPSDGPGSGSSGD